MERCVDFLVFHSIGHSRIFHDRGAKLIAILCAGTPLLRSLLLRVDDLTTLDRTAQQQPRVRHTQILPQVLSLHLRLTLLHVPRVYRWSSRLRLLRLPMGAADRAQRAQQHEPRTPLDLRGSNLAHSSLPPDVRDVGLEQHLLPTPSPTASTRNIHGSLRCASCPNYAEDVWSSFFLPKCVGVLAVGGV